jgi:crotonobetainyl-CoA:carnitine CoA-transferase CaiB-like acyl-CoA transferase
MVAKEREGALTGYRILDLTDSRGAYCTKLLADMGADVVKVEPPDGDVGRNMPPFLNGEPHPEKSLYFLYRNANKRGITLNIESDEGKDILRNLAESADVLVENYEPGYMDSLGLGYDVLQGINPKLIMASITEFGPDGPWRDYKGSNIVDFALSGVMITSGYPGKVPTMLPGTPAYDAASEIADIEILAAIYCRDDIGQGQKIDVSVHEAARTGLYPWSVPIYSYSLTPDGPLPMPEGRMGSQIFPVYPCKDGFVRVIAITPRNWQALVRVLGSPEVLLMPDWENFIYRVGNAEDLYAIMIEFTTKFTQIELWEAGFREGVPITPIYDIPTFTDSADATERKFFIEVDHPVAGKGRYPGPPYKWTETPPSIRRPAPRLGEHNQEIYCGELGFTKDNLTALRYAGVM